MTLKTLPDDYSLTVVRVGKPNSTIYSLDEAAHLAGLHPEMLRHYCHLGLFGDCRAQRETTLTFDDDALYELRRFEHFRQQLGVNRKTLRLLCSLWRQVEQLQRELRFLRQL